MPPLTVYINRRGGRRHAFQDCPHLRPGFQRMTIDRAFLDCVTCKRRLAQAQDASKGETHDAS